MDQNAILIAVGVIAVGFIAWRVIKSKKDKPTNTGTGGTGTTPIDPKKDKR